MKFNCKLRKDRNLNDDNSAVGMCCTRLDFLCRKLLAKTAIYSTIGVCVENGPFAMERGQGRKRWLT